MKTNSLITRRKAIVTRLSGGGGLVLSGCSRELPPTYGNILRTGDVLTYTAHRTLLPGQSLAREYSRKDISSFSAIGTTNPAEPGARFYEATHGPVYERLREYALTEWRLSIEGRVDQPGSYSLADLKRFHMRTQITRHTCEEGWSAIGEWTGVPLSLLLEVAGVLPSACFVSFYQFDDIADSIDMVDALHPQTILAYGMNGRDLSIPHGAPVRLRVEKQLGYKSVKYLRRIVVTNEFDDLGKSGLIQNGWSWYAGI